MLYDLYTLIHLYTVTKGLKKEVGPTCKGKMQLIPQIIFCHITSEKSRQFWLDSWQRRERHRPDCNSVIMSVNITTAFGLFHLISIPPSRGHMFLIVIPLRNSKLWQIPSLKPFTLEEFQAQNTLALKNSKLKTLYLEEFQSQNLLSLKNSSSWQISSPKLYILEKFSTQNTLPLKNSKPWIWSVQSSKHFTFSLKNLKLFIPEEFHYNDRHTPEEFHINFIVPWRMSHQLY